MPPFNGSGTFTPYSPGNPVVTNTTISSTAFNNTINDIATGLSTAITKDGQTTATANLPMGGYKLTGLGAGSAATDSANLSQVQSGVVALLGSVAGTNTITAAGSPAVTAYASGQTFRFIPAATNTGATTINIDSLGAKNIYYRGAALAGGEIRSGVVAHVTYDGTQFNLVDSNGVFPAGTVSAPAIVAAGDSNTGVFFPAADTVAVTTGGTERVRVDSAGNVGVGVTPSAWGSPFTALQFGPNGGSLNARTDSNQAIELALNWYYDGANSKYINTNYATRYRQYVGAHEWYTAASGTAGNAITWTTVMSLSAPAGYLTVPGIYNNTAGASNTVNVTSGGELYRVVSALKYKTNVRDLESVDINVLRPVRYNSNCRLDDPNKDQLGFIADEIAAAGYTELVNYGPDGAVEGLQYDRITVLLVKAVQELAAEVAALKAK